MTGNENPCPGELSPDRENEQYIWSRNVSKLRPNSASSDIQELPGHHSSKTTEIYTHISQKTLGKIQSPLDRFVKDEKDFLR